MSLERQAGFRRYDAVGYIEESYIILLILFKKNYLLIYFLCYIAMKHKK